MKQSSGQSTEIFSRGFKTKSAFLNLKTKHEACVGSEFRDFSFSILEKSDQILVLEISGWILIQEFHKFPISCCRLSFTETTVYSPNNHNLFTVGLGRWWLLQLKRVFSLWIPSISFHQNDWRKEGK